MGSQLAVNHKGFCSLRLAYLSSSCSSSSSATPTLTFVGVYGMGAKSYSCHVHVLRRLPYEAQFTVTTNQLTRNWRRVCRFVCFRDCRVANEYTYISLCTATTRKTQMKCLEKEGGDWSEWNLVWITFEWESDFKSFTRSRWKEVANSKFHLMTKNGW